MSLITCPMNKTVKTSLAAARTGLAHLKVR